MKKITILTLHLGYGGIEQYISSLCKMLEDDYEIEIISTYKILDKPAFDFSKKIKITYLIDDVSNKQELKESLKKLDLLKLFKEVKKSINILYLKYTKNIHAIKNIESDYVITTRIFHNKLVSKYLNKNITTIATDHNYHNMDLKYIKKLMNSCKNFDYFVAISKSLYESYKRQFKNTCVYIPNVLDNKPKKCSKLDSNEIVSIGRLSEEKGFSDLISVIDLVRQHVKNVKLHLIGDGELRETLEKKVKNLKLENNILLHGFLSKKDMEKYMLNSSLYVMTSYTESFGLVLLEAMSYGLPCVAFDSAAGAKELINSANGVLIKNRDKFEMARMIINLLNKKERRETLGENSRKYCDQYLSKNIKNDWFKILN